MLRSTATQRLTAMPGDRAVDNVAKRRKGEERRGTGTARGSPGRRADWKAPSGTPMSILGSVRPPDPSESRGPIVSSSTARNAGLKARSSGSGSHWPGVSHGLCPAPQWRPSNSDSETDSDYRAMLASRSWCYGPHGCLPAELAGTSLDAAGPGP